IIQLLIESGANVLAVDFDERLPLHHAAEQGMLDNISILLQANPETINEVDNRSLTALHIAAAAARTEACRLLLEKGAEVDYRDDERLTPLFYVASVGCPFTVKVLLEYDADLEARDKNRVILRDLIPYHHCCRLRFDVIIILRITILTIVIFSSSLQFE
ncbi:predicted protein, partial [Nematostella vectensis]